MQNKLPYNINNIVYKFSAYLESFNTYLKYINIPYKMSRKKEYFKLN